MKSQLLCTRVVKHFSEVFAVRCGEALHCHNCINVSENTFVLYKSKALHYLLLQKQSFVQLTRYVIFHLIE